MVIEIFLLLFKILFRFNISILNMQTAVETSVLDCPPMIHSLSERQRCFLEPKEGVEDGVFTRSQ